MAATATAVNYCLLVKRLLFAVGVGATVSLTACGSGGSSEVAQWATAPTATEAPSVQATSATPTDEPSNDPYPSVKDVTCRELSEAYAGGYNIGIPPNEWGGQLLAALLGADGVEATLTGFQQMGFALDLAQACLDPEVFSQSARSIGAALYRANKDRYTPSK